MEISVAGNVPSLVLPRYITLVARGGHEPALARRCIPQIRLHVRNMHAHGVCLIARASLSGQSGGRDLGGSHGRVGQIYAVKRSGKSINPTLLPIKNAFHVSFLSFPLRSKKKKTKLHLTRLNLLYIYTAFCTVNFSLNYLESITRDRCAINIWDEFLFSFRNSKLDYQLYSTCSGQRRWTVGEKSSVTLAGRWCAPPVAEVELN